VKAPQTPQKLVPIVGDDNTKELLGNTKRKTFMALRDEALGRGHPLIRHGRDETDSCLPPPSGPVRQLSDCQVTCRCRICETGQTTVRPLGVLQ
jgi:hypothetical protein